MSRRSGWPRVSGASATLLGALWLVPSLAAAQEDMPDRPSVSVTGSGSVQARPDQATLLLAVETVAPTAEQAAEENATKMTRIIAAVRGLGVAGDDVRTTSYNLSPIYRQEPRPMPDQEPYEPAIIGYRASNMVQVTLDDIELPGAVIDAAIDAGANRVAGLTFGLADPTAARAEALGRAVRNARAEAEAVVAAAGWRLGDPLRINVERDMRPMMMARMAMDMEMAARPTPVEPGELTVSATVTVVFELRSP